MRLLLFIVGVGAGNATRTLAWLDELRRIAPGVDVQVAAQGRALEILGERCDAHPMRSVTYTTGGDFGPMAIVRSNLGFPARFRENRRMAADLIRRLRPSVVVADSDFYCLGPARAAGVPLVSINNAAVVAAVLRRRGIPPGCGFSARFIEASDAWLQERYPDRVICPVLRPLRGLGDKYVQVPPIVRPECRPSDAPPGEEVVVVTGGSGIGTAEINLRSLRAPVVTCGARLDSVPPGTEQRGFSLDAVERMRRARVVVVQGGFSSVSEAAAIGRPAVVVPIRGHAEQHVNARLAERLGFGLASEGPDAGWRVDQILADYDRFAARSRAAAIPCDGARRTAREIARVLGA